MSADSIPLGQSIGYDTARDRSGLSVSAGGALAYRAGVAVARQLVWVDRGKRLGSIGVPEETALTSPQLAPDG